MSEKAEFEGIEWELTKGDVTAKFMFLEGNAYVWNGFDWELVALAEDLDSNPERVADVPTQSSPSSCNSTERNTVLNETTL